MSRKRLQWCCDEKCKGMLSFPDVVERASPPCPVRGEGICSISWPTILFLKKKKKEIQTFSAKNIWRLVPEHVLSDVLIIRMHLEMIIVIKTGRPANRNLICVAVKTEILSDFGFYWFNSTIKTLSIGLCDWDSIYLALFWCSMQLIQSVNYICPFVFCFL